MPRPCLALVARQGGDFDFRFRFWLQEVNFPTLSQRRRQAWGTREFGKGVNELQFKIKDQDYFLAFVEQERRWYVFAPTPQGVHRIPVYVDAAKYEKPAVLGTETTLSS